jgi:hypothetical protein
MYLGALIYQDGGSPVEIQNGYTTNKNLKFEDYDIGNTQSQS